MPDIFEPPMTLTPKVRAHRVEIQTPYKGVQSVNFDVERVMLDDQGQAVGPHDYSLQQVSRSIPRITTEEVTLQNGKTVSIIEIAEAIETLFVRWYQEDNA